MAPISNLAQHCEATWMKKQLEDDCQIMVNNNEFSQLSCDGRSCGLSVARTLHSAAVGVILVGGLKVSMMNLFFIHIVIAIAYVLLL